MQRGKIMSLKYIKAKKEDADMLIEIYNSSFYSDYVKYGECPAYGKTKEGMEASIEKSQKLIICYEDIPVGVVSVEHRGDGQYYLGCLCVIPSYQNKGIGTKAIEYILDYYKDWEKVTLVTPADKHENVYFYTKKCGFEIDGTEMDGNVKVFHFVLEKKQKLAEEG
jgi:ribosomal protein S18 acetylase RimI-like enzyme